jgi:hypothetical protein
MTGGIDQVAAAHDERSVRAWMSFLEQFFDSDFEFRQIGSPDQLTSDLGAPIKSSDAFIVEWRKWLAPWRTCRHEYGEPVEIGDSVVLPTRIVGHTKTGGVEVEQRAAGVFTFHEGKVLRFYAYLHEEDALKAVGLRE